MSLKSSAAGPSWAAEAASRPSWAIVRPARAIPGVVAKLLSLILLFPPSLALAQAEEKLEIRNLGQCGLVTRYASSQIGDTCLTEAENIYLDEDAGISRRKGFAKFNTTAASSQSVRGVWPFRATDGTEYMVALSSQTMYQSDGDGEFSAISPALAGKSATEDMDCQQCLGRLWCVNGSDTMFFWDGTSTGSVSGAPTCSAIDCFRNRVILGNCSGTLSQLRMSGELDGTDYTIPASPVSTSPAVISLGGVNDGKRLRCVMGTYQDVLVMGKEDSTWGLYGFDRRDFAVREISREVGCVENRSVREKQGSLYWLSKRGVEKMTGPSITRVSDPVRDLVDTIIVSGGNSRSNTDSSQTDFEAGNLTASGPGAPMSATISPGNIVPSSATLLDNTTSLFSLGTCSGCGVNPNGYVHFSGITSTYVFRYDANVSPTNDGWSITGSPTESVSGGSLTFTCSSGSDTLYKKTFSGSSGVGTNTMLVARGQNSAPNTDTTLIFQFNKGSTVFGAVYISTWQVVYRANGLVNAGVETLVQPAYSTYTVIVGTITNPAVYFYRNGVFKASGTISASPTVSEATIRCNTAASPATVFVDFFHISTDIPHPLNTDFVSVATFTSRILDTTFSTPTFGSLDVTSFPISGTTLSYSIRSSTSPNNDLWSSYASIANNTQPSDKSRYAQYRATFSQSGLTESPGITIVTLPSATTGYFISQCRNPGTAITDWGLFQCNQVLNNGGITFSISTGPTCNSVTRTTATFTAQTNNTVISVATAAYVAYRVLFDLDSGTETPTLNDCTINWDEGTSRPALASEVYRDRYYLAYTSGTSGTVVNDRLLVLDSRDQWVLHDAPNCSSLGLYNRKLYCGDSASTGFVYQMDVGQDDDGASFTSTIKTKDFDFGNTWQKKELKRMYYDLAGLPDPGYAISLTPSYTIDASTDTFSLNAINLNEDYSRFIAAKVPADLSNNVSARWFSFGLTHSGLQGPWKVFGLKIVFTRLTED